MYELGKRWSCEGRQGAASVDRNEEDGSPCCSGSLNA